MARHKRRTADEAEPTELLRGDSADGVAVPDPEATTPIVAHVLYLGGPGRPTPFTSTTESRETARYFAGKDGRVWETSGPGAEIYGASHIDHDRLLRDLTGRGKGRCKHTNAWEVKQAKAYVVQWSEHLLDWTGIDRSEARDRVRAAFV